MGEFNSEENYIYYCGQESLRRNEIAIIVKTKQNKTKQTNKQKKQSKMQYLNAISKKTE